MKWACLVVLVAWVAVGCSNEPEPTHKGRPLSTLIALTKDGDFDTSIAACKDLADFYRFNSGNTTARAALLALLDSGSSKAIAVAPATFSIDGAKTVSRLNEIIAGPNSYIYAADLKEAIAVQPQSVRAQMLPAVRGAMAKSKDYQREEWQKLLAVASEP